MADRRALIEGLDTIDELDRDRAEDFIFNKNPRTTASPAAPPPPKVATEPAPTPVAPRPVATAASPASSPLIGESRVAVGGRLRVELATRLKRARLERELQGIEPNSVQDILEEALELWLHKHGHPG